MSRVDFYILSDNTNIDRFACNIAAKAWSQGNKVYIHTQSQQSSDTIDSLLWTFRDISFIPHEHYLGDSTEESSVLIGHDSDFPDSYDVIINLNTEIPYFADQFSRIVEIVGGDESTKSMARQRYKQYKSGEYEMHDHKIDSLKEYG